MKIIIKFIFYLFLGLLFSFNNSQNINIENNISNDYYFLLKIPKINLEAKVYSFYDKMNNVDKGVYLVKNYDFTSLNGSLILASHSGNSPISHFKNLDMLLDGDIVAIIFNNKYYYYEIIDIYKIDKTGKFKYDDFDRGIYLITCDKKSNKKQLVFKGKLIKISKKSTFL